MNVLITGACGLLGSHLMAALRQRHSVTGLDRHPWWGDFPARVLSGDLTDPAYRRRAIDEHEPELLVHCAAMVNVDACEENPSLAYLQNARVTGALASQLPDGCRMVYVTTDGIFKGNRAFCSEAELPCPRTEYGRSKLHGEWETELAKENHVIVRTNFYGWSSGRKKTSAEWLYAALAEKREITLFDDFYFTPIYVVDLVERLIGLMEADHRGVFHLCGRDRVSKHEFGLAMAEVGGVATEHLRKGSIDDYPLIARRPRDMSLSSERYTRVTGVQVPPLRDGLRRFLSDRSMPLSGRIPNSTEKMLIGGFAHDEAE